MASRSLQAVGMGALLVLGLLSCGDSDPASGPLAPTRVSPPQHAGSETCAACHPSQAETWSRNPMARSLEVTELGELDQLGPVLDGPAGYSYRFTRSPDGARHILGEESPEAPEHALGSEVLFAVGAGTRDRSYVVGHGAGMWFAPVEVVTHPEGREAVLAPHVAMKPGARIEFPITSECLGCHTDSLPPRGFPLNLRQDPRIWKPRGISCVACHGEADAHASWQASTGEKSKADPLISHAQLSREEQLSVCAACHLQGDTRLVLDGPDLGPPKPGGNLIDSRALFVAREATEEVGFVSQVERLSLSECFLQSDMTCSACHDPHRSLEEPGERARVRAACLDCHSPDSMSAREVARASHTDAADACAREASDAPESWPAWAVQPDVSSDPDCVACHMPRTGVFDVARVTIHDHYIRTRPVDVRGPYADAELRALESPTADWKRFSWPGSDPGWGEDSGIWFMAYASKGFLGKAAEYLDEPPGPRALAIPMFHHLRAGLLNSHGRLEEARDAYERALELNPNLAESAINLGLLLGDMGDNAAGTLLLSEVIQRHPAAWGALRNRAVLRSRAGDVQGAYSDMQTAFNALPSADLASALAQVARGLGDGQATLRWEQIAVGLDRTLRLGASK